jgi:hypothetical protein
MHLKNLFWILPSLVNQPGCDLMFVCYKIIINIYVYTVHYYHL